MIIGAICIAMIAILASIMVFSEYGITGVLLIIAFVIVALVLGVFHFKHLL